MDAPDDLVVQVAAGESVRSRLGSLRGDGFFAVLASGRVCRIKPDADELALKALFSISRDDTDQIKDAIQDATAVPVPFPRQLPLSTSRARPRQLFPQREEILPWHPRGLFPEVPFRSRPMAIHLLRSNR